jgi:hypothetical protein
MVISSAELPFPQPIALFAGAAQKPMKAFQPGGYGQDDVAKSDSNQ